MLNFCVIGAGAHAAHLASMHHSNVNSLCWSHSIHLCLRENFDEMKVRLQELLISATRENHSVSSALHWDPMQVGVSICSQCAVSQCRCTEFWKQWAIKAVTSTCDGKLTIKIAAWTSISIFVRYYASLCGTSLVPVVVPCLQKDTLSFEALMTEIESSVWDFKMSHRCMSGVEIWGLWWP